MNRKLHNTFTGLISSGVLAIGLFAASPAMLTGADFPPALSGSASAAPVGVDVAPLVRDQAIASRLEAVALQLDTNAATPATVQQSRHASGKSRRIRQSMAMPFFSFAPRG